MIVVTPNTCIDVTTWLPSLVPGSVSRATRTEVTAGGKGVNVCRTLRALGYFNDTPLVSQRVINETINVLAELELRYPAAN